VRSFANEPKRLYGCYIPTSGTVLTPIKGITYVYDAYTDNWTTWDIPLGPSFAFDDGRMVSISRLKTYTSTRYYRQDVYTDGDPQNPDDQVDFTTSPTVLSISSISNTVFDVLNNSTFAFNTLYQLAAQPISAFVRNALGETAKVDLVRSGPSIRASLNYGQTIDNLTHIVFGVDAEASFNSFKGANPTALKQFSELQLFTEVSSTYIDKSFKTDNKATYSNPSSWTYDRENTTIYRTLIPLEAARGRLLFVRIGHSKPYENFAVTGQTLVYRDIGSFRNQRDS